MTNIHKSRRQKIIEILDEVATFFEAHKPEYYQWLLREIPKLRQVSTPGYRVGGSPTHVSVKVPALMFLCVQFVSKVKGLEPPFGDSMDDLALMTEQWKALDAHVPMGGTRKSLHVPKELWTKLFGGRRNEQHRTEDATREGTEDEEGSEVSGDFLVGRVDESGK